MLKTNTTVDAMILNIVSENLIREQSIIQSKLKHKGYAIPQATLSRRLKKLNIVKVAGIYKALGSSTSYLPLILDLEATDSGFIFIRTQPGNAGSIASYLDQKYTAKNCILGTLAGDDTVLLILKQRADQSRVMKLMRTEFPYCTLSRDTQDYN